MTSRKQHRLTVILPLAIIGIGGLISFWLVASSPETEKRQRQQQGLQVKTRMIERREHRLEVHAQGNVVPAKQIRLHPQVSGMVLTVHPNLAPGGIIRKGEQLVQIDPADYRLAVKQRQSERKEASAAFALEQGRHDVAEEEWELFDRQFEQPAPGTAGLALREPQLQSAKARLQRAQASLQQARLQLERTSMPAPFDALVVEESVDEGQQVQPQQAIATLVGAHQFWVRVSVPPAKIHAIDIPDSDARGGATAEVVLDLGGKEHRYQGQVIRMEGGLEPRSRMAQLIVAVDDPLGLHDAMREPKTQHFPLLLDAYVDVIINGAQPVQATAVPREAIHNGDEVYIYRDGKLEIRKPEFIWEREEEVLVGTGLRETERVIISPIPAPVEGMSLRQADAQQTQQNPHAENTHSSGSSADE